MTDNELVCQIASLDKAIASLRAESAALKQKLAELRTDLKVGDRVTYEGGKTVWELRRIAPCSWKNEPQFYGAKIKKDGTPGKSAHEIYVPYRATLVKIES